MNRGTFSIHLLGVTLHERRCCVGREAGIRLSKTPLFERALALRERRDCPATRARAYFARLWTSYLRIYQAPAGSKLRRAQHSGRIRAKLSASDITGPLAIKGAVGSPDIL